MTLYFATCNYKYINVNTSIAQLIREAVKLPVQNQVRVGGIKLTVMRFRDLNFSEFFDAPNLDFSFTVVNHDFLFRGKIFG